MNDFKAPKNTKKDHDDNPVEFLVDALAMGTSNAIMRQESEGQKALVNSNVLPTEMSSADRAILEAAGVRFLGTVEGDDLFQYVELPEGWQKKPAPSSFWSDLLDEKGRERAGIFYKAAFYDRKARLSCSRRYRYAPDWEKQNENTAISHVYDGDKIIYSTTPLVWTPDSEEKKYAYQDAADAEAVRWLETHYPEWRDAGAYWD